MLPKDLGRMKEQTAHLKSIVHRSSSVTVANENYSVPDLNSKHTAISVHLQLKMNIVLQIQTCRRIS